MSAFDFLVDRVDLSKTHLDEVSKPSIGDGEVLIRLDKFALTANNITYGVAGDMIGYWQFFKARDGLGRIPVWGIGTVVSSQNDEIKEGERLYGYYPMSSYLAITPGKISKNGLSDMAEHRQSLPPVYNQYSRMSENNGYPIAHDNYQIVYRPLFTTSFVLDDYFADNEFFGAEQIILSSASSKTSFGMAYMLKKRDIKVIGLTSAGNKEFVEGLGLYDETITYDEIESCDTSKNTAYVDMSGDRPVLGRIHKHFNDKLVSSCGVGATHWDAREGDDPKTLPGAKPEMFFAPSQIQKRNGEWGASVFQSKLSEAWVEFISDVETWVKFSESLAPAGLTGTYNTVLNGPAANTAYVVKVAE